MAKITLDTITSSFASTSLFNTNFTSIKDEFNNKVLYRDNPVGEPNQMLNDLDMNSNDIINAATINASGLTLGGVQVVPEGTTTLPALALTYDNTTSGLSANNVQDAIDEVEGRVDTTEIDITTIQNNQSQGQNYGKNLIINGDFSIWQRGTSQTSVGYGSDDRWFNNNNISTKVHNQGTFTLGQSDVPTNPEFYSSTVVTSGVDVNSFVLKIHRVENVTTGSGDTVTLSFWAKADAVKDIATEFSQEFGTGGSPSAKVSGVGVTTHTLSTDWQKFTVTTTLPSVSGKTIGTNGNDSLELNFWFEAGSNLDSRTNSLGNQSGTFDIANVQLEFGDTATEFEYVHPVDQLARCQRYFERLGANTAFTTLGSGYADTATRFDAYCKYVTKRDVPAVSISSATGLSVAKAGAAVTSTATAVFNIAPATCLLSLTTAGLVIGEAGCIITASSSDYIDIDAEL